VDKNKDSVKKDPRLMIDGKVNLPKNDNANYLWIQYFYNYLKPTGRTGFVMASSASDAGHSEKEIREKLVKTGAVDVMMAIGNNFFYTRSLPCTLWFFDRAKEKDKEKSDKVLMLDARKIYHKVTSKVNDFSPEQLQNLICIVNLYRGNSKKFETIVAGYLQTAADLATETAKVTGELQKVLKSIVENQTIKTVCPELYDSLNSLEDYAGILKKQTELIDTVNKNHNSHLITEITVLAKGIRKPQDKLIKQLLDVIASAVKEYQLNINKEWKELNLKQYLDELKNLQLQLCGNPAEDEPGLLHETEYFWQQAHWLTSRFPNAVYADVEGLCKVVTRKEIEAKDWSLSPGRYVGVDTSTDEDFDYEERLKEIHIELEGLNEEAGALAKLIASNYKDLAL
jgi:type I restriction enzyme M protein